MAFTLTLIAKRKEESERDGGCGSLIPRGLEGAAYKTWRQMNKEDQKDSYKVILYIL